MIRASIAAVLRQAEDERGWVREFLATSVRAELVEAQAQEQRKA